MSPEEKCINIFDMCSFFSPGIVAALDQFEKHEEKERTKKKMQV